MNMLKSLFALIFLISVVVCNQAVAQTEKPQKEQGQGQAQEGVEEYEEYNEEEYNEEYNEEVDPYQQSVTLDESEQTEGYTEEGTESGYGTKPATKIHIYSGAHDGDNIINPEPKH